MRDSNDTEKPIPTMTRLEPAVRSRLEAAARQARRPLSNEIAFRLDASLSAETAPRKARAERPSTT